MSKNQFLSLPPIGITMGCPAGIGPEIIIKYFTNEDCEKLPPAIIVGSRDILNQTADSLGLPVNFKSWTPGQKPEPGVINILEPAFPDLKKVLPGHPTIAGGAAMGSYIDQAITLCQDGLLSGITTCPISKATLNSAGYHFPGHTEFLAQRTGTDNVIMMMAGDKLKVTLATIHCPLASVAKMLSRKNLYHLINHTDRALKIDFNIGEPRFAVAALNPHAGEDCLFGTEEAQFIAPAIQDAVNSGIKVSGPYPADTVFYQATAGKFDAVICMYHDQGLIPFKLLHFSDGVNVTLGLPIVRTSVDHGTAYDIAGKGIADYQSLKSATIMASMIAANRRNL